MFNIEEELKKLPAKPGVYLMHDEKDNIIYVGKAISLKNRVRQYFQTSRNKGAKIEQMVTHISRFEYIVTDSELEALVLECNLIKEHRPKYNTMLMDDKGYPFIKVTTNEAYPRVMLARTVQKDKAKYFGPYTSTGAVKDTIELIRKLYHIRNCSRNLPKDMGKERPCLNYHIKQCEAPCQGYISKEEYAKSIEEVLRFLSGHYENVLKDLERKMYEASENMEFEKAAEYLELLNSVKRIAEKQKITDNRGEDRDILAIARDEEDAVVQVFFIRNGRLIGRDHFFLANASENSKDELLSTFIKQFYAGTPFIPAELMLQEEVPEQELLEEWLTKRREQRVHIRVPKKGEKEKLVELAKKNAELVLSTDKERLKREEGRTIGAVKEIEQLLGLSHITRMESFDISNISAVAQKYDDTCLIITYNVPFATFKAVKKYYSDGKKLVQPSYKKLEESYEREDKLSAELKALNNKIADMKKSGKGDVNASKAKAAKLKVEFNNAKKDTKALQDEFANFNRAAKPYNEAKKLLTQSENYQKLDEISAIYEAAKVRHEATVAKAAEEAERKTAEEKAYREKIKLEKAAAKAAKKNK